MNKNIINNTGHENSRGLENRIVKATIRLKACDKDLYTNLVLT